MPLMNSVAWPGDEFLRGARIERDNMKIVAVVRPGWTDFDEQHRLIGALELPLNARGVTQVAGLIEQLRTLSDAPEAVLCGMAQPATCTAEAIAEAFDLTTRKSEELSNLNQGLWQGSTTEEIGRRMSRVQSMAGGSGNDLPTGRGAVGERGRSCSASTQEAAPQVQLAGDRRFRAFGESCIFRPHRRASRTDLRVFGGAWRSADRRV